MSLFNKQYASSIVIKRRNPDKPTQDDTNAPSDIGITTCAEALIRAIENKDPKAAATAIKDAFTILDSQPHEEGPHTSDTTVERRDPSFDFLKKNE